MRPAGVRANEQISYRRLKVKKHRSFTFRTFSKYTNMHNS